MITPTINPPYLLFLGFALERKGRIAPPLPGILGHLPSGLVLGSVDSLDHTSQLLEFISVCLYNVSVYQSVYGVTCKQGGLAGLRYASPLQPAEQVVRVRYRSIHFVCGDPLPINPPGSYRMNNATDSKLRRSRPAQKVLYVGLQRVLRML